jgi:hypothetical protein
VPVLREIQSRRSGLLIALAVGLAAGLAGAPAVAAKGSAPSFDAARPGPAILYAPPPRAPQLENAPGSPWQAQPILISGTSAYREGEFLYQDFLFDDRGAGSTLTYPTDPRYGGDAADLVEFRMKAAPGGGLFFRLTYNTMIDPDLVASTIALGDSATPEPLPFNAGAQEPAQVFVTVHGSTVDATDAATGTPIDARGARSSADLFRRQVTIFVPPNVFDTRGLSTLRVAAASGLWDTAGNQYLQPVNGAATATQPGNGGTAGSALFNVAFRFNEPFTPTTTLEIWRDSEQAAALQTGDLSAFFADVNLDWLRTGVTNNMYDQPTGVPTHGMTDRIYASHFGTAAGRGPQPPVQYCHEPCNVVMDYTSQLQPYGLYVPDKPAPPTGYGMTLNLHFCTGNYNNGPPDAAQLADRSTGSLVLTPEARGRCFWYWGESGADVFEAWADAGRHFRLDPDYNAISGWSMGGYGTYKLAAEFPDLFAAALPDIGCVSAETGWPGEPTPSISGEDAEILNLVGSFRNIPFLMANANMDTLCDTSSQLQVFQAFQTLGYRYDWREYAGEHGPYYPTADESAQFLGNLRVNPNPPHVTYTFDVGMQEPAWGLNANHAYWVSGLTTRSGDLGTVDAFSHGFGLADPQANPEQETSGTSGSFVYTGSVRTWQQPQQIPATDELDLTLTNIATVTIDTRRARIGCDADLHVTSDGPATVTLAGCHRTITVR